MAHKFVSIAYCGDFLQRFNWTLSMSSTCAFVRPSFHQLGITICTGNKRWDVEAPFLTNTCTAKTTKSGHLLLVKTSNPFNFKVKTKSICIHTFCISTIDVRPPTFSKPPTSFKSRSKVYNFTGLILLQTGEYLEVLFMANVWLTTEKT